MITVGDGPMDEVSEKLLAFYLSGLLFPKSDDHFKLALVLEDVMSGATLSIPLPSEVTGANRNPSAR